MYSWEKKDAIRNADMQKQTKKKREKKMLEAKYRNKQKGRTKNNWNKQHFYNVIITKLESGPVGLVSCRVVRDITFLVKNQQFTISFTIKFVLFS